MFNSHNDGGLSRRGLLKGATALSASALILPAGMRRADEAGLGVREKDRARDVKGQAEWELASRLSRAKPQRGP